ncbi:exodeoxyribonuclease VII large subunit [Geomonas nitrogeniifigens]|uniref:exodeoxyribonuclease VII large subunit n=1 Tax=Geomonas diazotrophica TaxID=2843197 RepID=UPI001C2B8E88|nr:exodeoxyribonuclease VII large subunit [Geomonas nitrogeniifigens]QXE87361.1 exodeoxyribonuclease VII large subunit [Geomonas nitrogeniifigens]
MEKRIFPLSTITRRITELLEPAINKQFWVKAEISSGRERGGAFYCDLIETDAYGKMIAKMACTIWQRDLSAIRGQFRGKGIDLVLDNGTVVGFQCSLQFSAQYGLSLRVIDADPSFALGEMELKKREIIERLQKEGLFEPNKQRFAPLLPLRIGLVTSANSAAYNDFIQTLTVSGFGFRIYLADALMQGDQTERSVLKAIDALCRLDLELIVIARGGGSKTDLYYLDNESIARRIAACPLPVWSGIGHEIDTSVLDHVTNKAFKTPTAVAEELVARFVQMRRQLDEATGTLRTVWDYKYKNSREYLVRADIGIRQGTRKHLELVSSGLREQANQLHIRVTHRIAAEHLGLAGKRERLRSQPVALVQGLRDRLSSRGQILGKTVRFLMATASTSLASLKVRFTRERFLRHIKEEGVTLTRTDQQIRERFRSAMRLRSSHLTGIRDRFRLEKYRYFINTERKSLNDKLAVLRAIDPKNALQRGFALVYRADGSLARSIVDVAASDRLRTRLADGYITSEVTSKEQCDEQ